MQTSPPRSEDKAYARGVAALGAGAVVSRLGYFISISIIAKSVGVAGFGRFSLVLTIFVAFSIIANFGLENLAVRTIARGARPLGPFLAATSKLRLLGLPVAAAIVLALTLWDQESMWLVVLLGIYGLGNAAILFDVALFRGVARMELQTALLGGQAVLSIVFVAIAMVVSATPEAAALAYVAATGFTVLAGWILRQRLHLVSDPTSAAMMRPLFDENLPFALMLLGLLIFDRSALVLLGLFEGDEAVGWFSAAYLVLIAAANLPNVVINATFPALSRAAADSDATSFSQLVSRILATTALVGAVVALGLYLLAGPFMSIAFGADFDPSAAALRRLAWAVPLLFLIVVLNGVLQAADAQVAGAKAMALGLIAGLPVSVVLISANGFDGAANGYVVVALTMCVAMAATAYSHVIAGPQVAGP